MMEMTFSEATIAGRELAACIVDERGGGSPSSGTADAGHLSGTDPGPCIGR